MNHGLYKKDGSEYIFIETSYFQNGKWYIPIPIDNPDTTFLNYFE